ncbi:MAG: hypothetical protein KDA52_06295 [Planctomycetaceae bacterium]|nr:hypothetical protein [Planctomycetaceae bacterium]
MHDTHSELTALEQRQGLLAHHVRLVARKLNHALFVFGSQGGLGKSRTITTTLDDEGVAPILINSHVTPLSLYAILYQHRDDEVLFFDDVDSMFGSMPHLGLLRSALWGSPRIVTYNSSQLNGLPPMFEFTSRCIFAANVIPKKNDAFKAVLSRCDQFELSASNEEVVDLMRSVASAGFNGITPDECEAIIDFIAENSSDRQLSMRLLGPSIRKFQYAKTEGLDWRLMVKSQLQTLGRKQEFTKRLDNQHRDLQVLQTVQAKFPESVKDQQAAWCNSTGKSRASFFRTLSRFRDADGK